MQLKVGDRVILKPEVVREYRLSSNTGVILEECDGNINQWGLDIKSGLEDVVYPFPVRISKILRKDGPINYSGNSTGGSI